MCVMKADVGKVEGWGLGGFGERNVIEVIKKCFPNIVISEPQEHQWKEYTGSDFYIAQRKTPSLPQTIPRFVT